MLTASRIRTPAFSIAILLSALAVGPEARADFLYGQTLSVAVQDAALSPALLLPPVQFVVNNTVELGISNHTNIGNFDLEVDDTSITFTYSQTANFSTASFNGYVFQAISAALPGFGGISVDAATTLAGFDASRLSYDSKTFDINVSGLSAGVGTVLKLDVQPAATTPEPSSLILTACGLVGLAGLARNRRRPA